MKNLFKNASQDFRRANPQLMKGGDAQCQNLPDTGLIGNGAAKVRSSARAMNRTEAEFALILEGQKQRGEILRFEYEGITLRWAGIRYTPDFVVFCCNAIECPSPTETTVFQHIKLIEIKGAWTGGKFERAVERFRHARTYWKEFSFELWQKNKTGWERKM